MSRVDLALRLVSGSNAVSHDIPVFRLSHASARYWQAQALAELATTLFVYVLYLQFPVLLSLCSRQPLGQRKSALL
jgi:hypothetical protein